MNTMNTKKLSLNKETLRILGDDSLKDVAGASAVYTCETQEMVCWGSEIPCTQGWFECGI